MKRRLAFAVPLLLFALLALALWRAMAFERALPSPLIDRPAPAFVLPRLDDPARTVARDELLGRVWLLNVWASWCAGCRDEHPALMALARDAGVPVIGLNHQDARADAQRWLQRHGDPYAFTLHDPSGRTGMDFGVYGVPETYVVDRDGRVRLKLTGALTRERIERELRPLLQQLAGL